jgi:hypothetical protein
VFPHPFIYNECRNFSTSYFADLLIIKEEHPIVIAGPEGALGR